MARMSKKEKLGALVQNELSRAEGGHEDYLQTNRAQALEYYWADPRGDERKNRSAVVSTDVADMVNAVLAMLTPMLSSDVVVTFEAEGKEDELQAAAESEAVSQVVMQDNFGFMTTQEAIKDGLLMKNGCLKIAVTDKTDLETFALPPGMTGEQVGAFITEIEQSGAEVERMDDELKIKREQRRFEINSVPIENISYQAGYQGELQDIRFFAEMIPYTRSDLVERGISRSVVEKLPRTTAPELAASRVRDRGARNDGYDAETEDQDTILCHEAYVRVDLDGDGMSERYRVLVADENKCLEYELVDLLPYALGSPFLNAHRITGESLFDHLKQTQDTKTAYHRQLIDNVTTINNGKYAYDPSQVAEKDVMTPQAGGGIRARNPLQSVVPIPIPDVSAGILAALGYEDKARSERGGASLDMLGAEAQIVGETAHGIERQYSSREALAAMMAKNLAETLIRGIYQLTHEYLRRYADKPLLVTVQGQSVPTDPRTWRPRTRVEAKAGMSPGERTHLQQTLLQHVQFQTQALQSGMAGILADAKTIYRTTLDWLRASGIPNPERLLIDPASPEAQEAAQQQAQQAEQQAQMQMQLMERQIAIEEQKIAADARAKKAATEHDYYDTDARVAIEEAKLANNGVITLEQERMRNETARETAAASAAADTGGSTQ